MKMMFVYIMAALALSTCGSGRSKAAAFASVESFEELDATLMPEDVKAVVEWDKTVHDFGDVSVSDGPLTCSFTLTNTGAEPITIFEVVSSCGCTGVDFPKGKIEPGQSAVISATYKNEDGPTAFDKTLTVYISGIRRPVILRLRGVVHPKKQSLSQLYSPGRLGDFGLKTRIYSTGALYQGLSVSETANVANLGKKALSVSFTDVSPQLSISVSPNPIPPGKTATMAYTVNADPSLYGCNEYSATPVLNGEKADSPITVVTWTKENFALWDRDAVAKGSNPAFETSTFSFGSVKAGGKVSVSFPVTNNGESAFHVFKADSDSPALLPVNLPDVAPKGKGKMEFILDTSTLPEGDNVIMLSLTTNSPQRPLINLFVTGVVK
ncbi:MAG: DUF1573 domain-containing protein [Bacteroidales bacterium]|nr:DUF1573 domain-containing protein [Bacteroidales bacterium]